MNAQERSALISAKAAILGVVLTILIQFGSYFLATRDKRKEELMQHRRESLMSALEVVDHIYSNLSMSGKPPSNPHLWDISLARSAMNGIIIYCKNPNKVLSAFSKATGIINSSIQSPILYGPKDLAEFRDVVCEELEVSSIRYTDINMLWIRDMPGAK